MTVHCVLPSPDYVFPSPDPAMEGVQAAVSLSPPPNEHLVLAAIMDEMITLPVSTIGHIPRRVRPLLAEVLSAECRHSRLDGLCGFVWLSLLAKTTLRAPPRRGKKKRYVVGALITARLHRWQDGDIAALLVEARNEAIIRRTGSDVAMPARNNARRALRLAQEGRISDAMRTQGATGCASSDNMEALSELVSRHPEHPLPSRPDDYSVPPHILVDSEAVLMVLRAFLQGNNLGGTRLRDQHILDAVVGITAPVATVCLAELTLLMNILLAVRMDHRAAPWLVGAPVTALVKKGGGFRPIAVCEVIRRLASRLCCTAVRRKLPELFLPYNQVGVGMQGGLEAAIHSIHRILQELGQDENLCCFKVDMQKAFNECDRATFLRRLSKYLPELEEWVRWCYCSAGELRFGSHQVKSTAGVQQSDPLGPLLFSLAVLELLDTIDQVEGLVFTVWYLDDGTFVGTRDAIASLLDKIQTHGPNLGPT